MTPLASVAMLEKFALLKIAFWSAPARRSVSCRLPSVMTSTPAASASAADPRLFLGMDSLRSPRYVRSRSRLNLVSESAANRHDSGLFDLDRVGRHRGDAVPGVAQGPLAAQRSSDVIRTHRIVGPKGARGGS